MQWQHWCKCLRLVAWAVNTAEVRAQWWARHSRSGILLADKVLTRRSRNDTIHLMLKGVHSTRWRGPMGNGGGGGCGAHMICNFNASRQPNLKVPKSPLTLYCFIHTPIVGP